jgi:hypothetical protein
MSRAVIAVLLRLLAPEPTESRSSAMQTDDVFLPTTVAHAPEPKLMQHAEAANVAEFLDDADKVAGPDIFMPVGASTATWQPSRSAAEFLGPRPAPVWLGCSAVAGPEAFMSSRDTASLQPEVFMPTSGHKNDPAPIFIMGTVRTVSWASVFMSTAG